MAMKSKRSGVLFLEHRLVDFRGLGYTNVPASLQKKVVIENGFNDDSND
ncbi:hypothetical protein [Enterococcus rivorum]|nr:hypothetical protein [Enterococcus rivorum]MBP2097673.1 hypothetical protein [Enterococcus rivorum]